METTNKSQKNGRLETAPDQMASKGARILLAEDDDEMRQMLALSMRRAGYVVHENAGGIELLDLLAAIVTGETLPDFDLVVSDIRMPVVTGLEMLEGMRSRKTFGKPIILITAFGDEQTKREASRFGAAAVLDKPFEISQLLSVMRMTLMSATAENVEVPDYPTKVQQLNKGNRLSSRERRLGRDEEILE